MLAIKVLSSAFLLATTVIADGASIVAAIDLIEADTIALNNTVTAWSGDLAGVVPITTQSSKLQTDINAGTTTATASAPLTEAEALAVAAETVSLITAVQQTLDTIVRAKPKFDAIQFSSITLSLLRNQRTASAQFGAAVIAKVPASLQESARTLIAQIDQAFANAIAAYS